MKFILGKKNKMTQLWRDDKVLAVTEVKAGPCFVSQVKSLEKDSYNAIQIAYDEKKPKNISKPVRGHLKKAGLTKESSRYLREFRVKDLNPKIKTGDIIDVSTFSPGDKISLTSISKGKGFQGVVKRWGFAGSNKTHGNKDQLRASGSIGALGPAQVFKGKKMAGRMGGDRVTIKNLEIIEVDLENNVLFIKGSVPGARNSLVLIKSDGDLLINGNINNPKEEAVKGVEEKPEGIEERKDSSEVGAESNKSEKLEDDNKEEKIEEKSEEKVEDEKKETPEEIKNKEEEIEGSTDKEKED